MVAFKSSSILPYQPVHIFVKCKDVNLVKDTKETNKSHGITQSNINGVLKGIFKIYSKDEFTDNRVSTLNPNHCYSPISYYLNMKAHFNMLIVVVSLNRHMHDN